MTHSINAYAQSVFGRYDAICNQTEIKLQNNQRVALWADKGLIIINELNGQIDLKNSRLEITQSLKRSASGEYSNAASEEGVVRIVKIQGSIDQKYVQIMVELPYNSEAKRKLIQFENGKFKNMKVANFLCALKKKQITPAL